MSKKAKKNKKGTVMTLGDFQGPNAGRDEYNLPTSSSGISMDDYRNGGRDGGGGRYGSRDRDRGDRFGGDGDGPSRADESDGWRSMRRGNGGGGGGGGSFGRSDGGDAWRRDRGGPSGPGRFGPSSGGGRFGGGGGDRFGGGGGDRFGSRGGFGDRDRNSDRGGGDDRPAHLKLRLRKAGESSDVRQLSNKVSSLDMADRFGEAGRPYDALGNDSDVLDAKAAAAAEAAAKAATRNVDESLTQTESVEISKLNSSLNKAMEAKRTVSAKEVHGNLTSLDLTDDDVSFQLGACLAKSLVGKTLTLDELVAEIEADLPARLSQLLTLVLKQIKTLDGVTALTAVVSKASSPIASLVTDGKTGADLDAALNDIDLFELKPVPNVEAEVMDALKSGKGAAAALAIINDAIDSKLSVSYLSQGVAGYVLDLVFADKKSPALGELETHVALLQRCCSQELETQVELVFQTSELWYKRGKVPTSVKPVFEKLHELEVLSHAALVKWKESTRKGSAKMQTLLKLSMWIKDIAPVVPQEEEDEDEEEEVIDALGYEGNFSQAPAGGDAW